jgi:hypothetical protein
MFEYLDDMFYQILDCFFLLGGYFLEFRILYIICFDQIFMDENASLVLLFIGLMLSLHLGWSTFLVDPVFSLGQEEKDTNSVQGNDNATSSNGKNMTMSTRNMTFGSSLDNAKMHLMEAIMDLKEGNTKGIMIQLNMTEEGIKMHEKEMMQMMGKQNISNSTAEPEK